MLKRFLHSRLTRWTACIALVAGADLAMKHRFTASSLTAQEKKEAAKEKKKSADDLRKELEEKLKGVDLNDPKFDEITKEYEKLIKEAIGKIPQAPNGGRGPIVVGPDQLLNQQKMNDEIRRRQQQGLERGGFLPVFPNQQNPFILEIPNRPTGGRFGIMIEAVPDVVREQVEIPANAGQVVREVTRGSIAEKVGMKVNDIVIEFGGKPAPADTQEFVQMVLDFKADVETTAVVIRKGKKETIKGIKLPEVKAQAPQLQQNIDAAVIGDVEKLLQQIVEVESRPIELADDLVSEFTVQSNQNGVQISITGSRAGKEKQIKSITIKEGDTSVEFASVDKLPEKYREVVQKLLKNVK